MADRDHDVLNTPQTVFRLGSVTKQFTALAILQLQQMESSTYRIQSASTSRVSCYLQPITIHHLLTNTLAFPN